MNATIAKKRVHIIDALRGFALAGIVIVHMVENYTASPTPEGTMLGTHQGIADNIVDGFIFLFLRGKFFALFSFLFGLSFFLQMDSAHKKGQDLSGRFLWRLILLLGIGLFHHLFYRGDILTIYAILGIFLIPFYKTSNKWLLAITALIFLGIGRYAVFLLNHGEPIFMSSQLDPSSPEIAAYFDILKNGSLAEVFYSNTTQGHLMKMEFQTNIFGRAYLTFGFFLLGLFVGRLEFFRNFIDHMKSVKKVLIWSVVLFFISIGLGAVLFAQLGPEVSFDNWLAMFALTAIDINNIAMTFILISLFVMAFKTKKGKRWLLKFAPYGRMALSNYVLQSIIGTALLYGWGMGYLGELRNIYTFLIAFLIIALQMVWSTWWLQKYHYGPFEWLWRSLTYFRRYPLKRISPQKY
ncbi:MAG: DUF418 domain-containing protein [Flavobacteriaceae bacterium]